LAVNFYDLFGVIIGVTNIMNYYLDIKYNWLMVMFE